MLYNPVELKHIRTSVAPYLYADDALPWAHDRVFATADGARAIFAHRGIAMWEVPSVAPPSREGA